MELQVQDRRALTAKPKAQVGRLVLFVIAVVMAVLFLAPIMYAVVSSLKPSAEANASPPGMVPSQLSLDNYELLQRYGIGIAGYVRNSVVVTTLTIAGALGLGVLGGYGFSRFEFPGKNILFVTILATMMIPFQTVLVPLFVILNRLNLTSSLFGLALVYVTFQLPFSIFIMRNSFDSVPDEIEEAAMIDGCGPIRSMIRVLAPIALPGMVTVVLFAFLAAWNEFLAALILLTRGESFTLPVMLLSAQQGQYGTIDWGILQAGITVAMVPAVLLFLLLQRYYLEGLSAGAVKA